MAHIHSYNKDISAVSFHTVDQHAQKVPMTNIYSEDCLIQYLAAAIEKEEENKNIFLARAFVVFLNEINIARRSGTFNVSETMQKIIYGSPTDSFYTLCCKVGIEVEVMKGMTKGSKYQPGVTDTESLQKSQWCAFKSDNSWHLVHPQWSIVSMFGYSHDGVVIEGDGKAQSHLQSQGQTIHAFNDFWFCTKPEIFIHHCYPDNADWQLLPESQKTLDEFLSLPFLQQGYYEAGLKLLSDYSCALCSTNGVCIISFAADKKVTKNLEFSYTLTLLAGDRTKVRWDDLCQLVMFIPSEDVYTFKISLPVEGTYSFEIMILADDIVTNASCADFRIECKEACKNCRKVPWDVGIEGFGYGNEAKEAGLKHPSQRAPFVILKPPEEELGSDCEDETIDFHIDSDRVNEMEFRPHIVGGSDKKTVLTDAYVDGKKGKLVIKARATKSGDYTLAIKAREKKTESDFKTVINLMLTTDTSEKNLYSHHENVVKQRKREITKEETLADKTKRKTELVKKIEDFRARSDT